MTNACSVFCLLTTNSLTRFHAHFSTCKARGAEGFDLHGGACKGDGSWYRELAYECRGGNMHVNLLAMGVSLGGATRPGQGGYVIVPGSHKSNFAVPDGVQNLTGDMLGLLHNPALEAGDVLLFTEAATHGAVPWSGGGGGGSGGGGEGAGRRRQWCITIGGSSSRSSSS